MALLLSSWMIYAMYAVLGLMMLDVLIALFQSFRKGTFKPSFVLDYLKDVLFYIFPLNVVVSLLPIDPTGWILMMFYFLGSFAIIIKYITDIKDKFR
jgi:hypothetical protein